MANTWTSWIWDHLKKMEENKAFMLCKICGDEVYYSKDYSTSMVVWHLGRHHKQVFRNRWEAEVGAKLASENKASYCQQSMYPFLFSCNRKFTTWYQEMSHGNQDVGTDSFLLGS
jgi:hypothetical protein